MRARVNGTHGTHGAESIDIKGLWMCTIVLKCTHNGTHGTHNALIFMFIAALEHYHHHQTTCQIYLSAHPTNLAKILLLEYHPQ